MKSIHRLSALVLLAALLLPACAQNSPNVPDTTAALQSELSTLQVLSHFTVPVAPSP